MRLGFDLDGVLARITEPLMEYHNQAYGTNLSWEDIYDFDLSGLWGCSKEEYVKRVNDFYHSPLFDKIPPFEDAKDAVYSLKENNDLIIITARPSWLIEKTEFWTEKQFPGCFVKKYFTNQLNQPDTNNTKAAVCLAENIKIIVEDHIKYAQDCARAGIKVLLRDRRWNKKQEDTDLIKRIYSLSEIKGIVESYQ